MDGFLSPVRDFVSIVEENSISEKQESLTNCFVVKSKANLFNSEKVKSHVAK